MPDKDHLEKKLAEVERRAREGDAKAAAKQRAENKLTARERIEKLLDPGSFVEEFMLATTQVVDFGMAEKREPGDGVVAGFGKIEGRPVYLFAQDRAVLAGTVGSAHAEKIAYVIQTARRLGVPLIGLYDSPGARIQEGLTVTAAIGKIFFENSVSSGSIPQISAIMGPCIGVAAYSPALTDFIVMVQGSSQMFITGPAVIKEVLGEQVSLEGLGGAKIHSEVSGVSDLTAKDDAECLAMIRRLVGFLPQNFSSPAPWKTPSDDPERPADKLEKIVPDDMRRAYNVVQVIRDLADDGDFLELKPKFARNLVIGLARLDGHPVGFVANQAMFLAGSLDVDAADKGARFIRFCDAFNIPLVTFEDVPGFLPGVAQEHGGIIKHGAKLLFAYCEATVPKLTVITRKAYGGAYDVMSSKHIRGDYNVAWPTAEIAVMGPKGAVEILYKGEANEERTNEYREKFAHPYQAAARGYLDDIIDPRDTRPRLIEALLTLETKRAKNPPKKHGNIPL